MPAPAGIPSSKGNRPPGRDDIAGHLPTPRRWGAKASRGACPMTKHGSFKKVVRRHARDTDQRYTEALSDLEGVGTRMFHAPVAKDLLAHLRGHHGIDAVAATKASRHNDHVFR